MFAKRIALTAAIAAFLQAEPASAQQALQPVKPWDLDYGETECIAARDYGSVSDPTTLAIRPAPNGETYELLIARKGAGPEFAEQLEGSVDFGQGPIKAWLLHYQVNKTKIAIYKYRISAAEIAQARSATALRLHVQQGPDTKFSLEAMPALLRGLEQCTADLKAYWNMDGDKTDKTATSPRGSLIGVFSGEDYPTEAQGRNQEGRSQFLLLIDEKGLVAGCYVQVPSGIPALDARGCEVIRARAKFAPARDRNGTPVRSTVLTPPINWRLEG